MDDVATKERILRSIEELHRKIDDFRRETQTKLAAMDDTLPAEITPPLLNSRSSGFTLVELAIVLVIIGLLAGGVLVGRDMIRAAELRSVTADLERFIGAITAFKEQYHGLPGDLKNATAFWGVQAGTGSDTTCFNSASSTKTTCNGNGNGQIYTVDGLSYSERYRAWQHLANAGLIEGSYTGFGDVVASEFRTPGVNVPAAKGGLGYYLLTYFPSAAGNPHYFDRDKDSNVIAAGVGFTPAEMQSIDTKMDDGKPGTGWVFVYKASSTWMPNCATTDVVSTALYNVTNTGKICSGTFETNY